MSSKQRRQGLRLSAQKAVTAVESLRDQQTPSAYEQLQKKGVLLKSYLERIETVDMEILAAATDPKEIEVELENIRIFNDCLLEAIAECQPVVLLPTSPIGPATNVPAAGGADTVRVRLPQLQIPPFEGDPLRWQEFWDSYKASIHDRPDLNPVDKFTYLRGLLKGDPFNLVEGFRVTDANYEPVISLLSQRYGDKEAVIFAHIEALLAVHAASGDVSSLIEMHSSVERHLRSLDSLQPDPDAILYAVLLSKLPRFLKIEAHRQRVARDQWDFKMFRKWLQEEIRAREMGDRLQLLGAASHRPGPTCNQRSSMDSVSGKMDTRKRRNAHSASFLVSQSKPASCPFCGSAHDPEQCSRYPDTQSRRAQLGNRCLSCLKRGHLAKVCNGRRPCRFCQRLGHHSSLCFTRFGKPRPSENAKPAQSKEISKEDSVPSVVSHGDPIVSVATLSQQSELKHKMDRTVMQTAMVDLCLVSGAQQLKSSRRSTREYKVVEFGIKCRDGSMQQIVAAVVPTITCPIQKIALDPQLLTVPAWTLAEPMISTSEYVGIDILIGMDYYHSFMLPQRVQAAESLWFQASTVGYVLSGRTRADEIGPETVAVMLLRTLREPTVVDQSDGDVSKFWDLEEIGMKESRDGGTSDEDAVSSFASTVKLEDGRYSVSWPWKQSEKELKDNRALAFGRLKSVVNQLKKSPDTLNAYDDVFRSQLEAGIIEKVPRQIEPDAAVYYMPHHGVFNPDKPTTKLRVVFDASSKVNAEAASLNECLHRGPVWLEDLCGLLLRFRTHAVALVSDIEKAFLQIGLQLDQRDVTRFLWLDEASKPPVGANVITYRFCRVPFGVISSPFLLAATVAHHLKQQSSPVAARIARDIYVDNVITGEASLSDAFSHYTKAKSIFCSASMNLREWHSNSTELMKRIPREDHGRSMQPKVLGLRWDISSDTLHIGALNLKVGDSRVTKRIMLKILAQIFDPCGFLAPIVVTGKLMIQDIWARKLTWDEDVPDEVQMNWQRYVGSCLQRVHHVIIPRYIGNTPSSRLQLHAFCDASTKACAVAVYMRLDNPPSLVAASLILAKTRLAPLKQNTTIPRMELVAAVLGTRVLRFAVTHLNLVVDAQFLWTDSQCVLHWMKKAQVATKFVANRVTELKKANGVQFRYVPTAENPADLPTRGCDADSLSGSALWWQGPKWLTADTQVWPLQPHLKTPEVEPADALLAELIDAEDHRQPTSQQLALIDSERFSSLNRLLRVTAFVLRFTHNTRAPVKERRHGNLLLKEIASAQIWWIKEVQSTIFAPIPAKLRQCRKPDKLSRLNTFRDEHGLLRCDGRIDNSDLPYDARFPILLPKTCHLTRLIVKACHERVLHSGAAVTLSNLRQQFWVPSGRSVVKKLIRSCKVCIRYGGGPFRVPAVPPLPKLRLEESPPFTNTGLDYLGPLLVRKDDQNQKVWICLYTCAVTRAVHLEVVQSLSTEDFLLALRRFVALFGPPKVLVSDNGRQFQAASKMIQKFERDTLNSDNFQDFSLSRSIEWNFIPEMSPWMGGFYERLVGVVKSSLKKSLQVRTVNLVQLQTLIAEVASVVNSRPLTYVEAGPDSLPLTPSQFLSPMRRGNNLLIPPADSDPDYQQAHITSAGLIDRWRKTKSILVDFWHSWRSNYLLSLRERCVSSSQRGASPWIPSVGSIVHLKDNLPRTAWRIGKITSLCKSADGKIRSAFVRVSNGSILRRPLKLLYPLEIDGDPETSHRSEVPESVTKRVDEPVPGKIRRAAAVRARNLWKQQQQEDNMDEEH